MPETVQPHSSPIIKRFNLQVFCDDDYSGNAVEVVLLDGALAANDWNSFIDLSAAYDHYNRPKTVCIIHLHNTPECYWFQGGKAVKLCGSALIAAAYSLHKLSDNHYSLPLTVQGPSSSIRLHASHGEYGFALPRFTLIEEALPVNANHWFEQRPINTMATMDSQGYWIMEFEQSVANLQPQLDAICAGTQRAIIATSLQAPTGYDYELRYFAPQYGMNEDIATGSANAVLASYWQHKLNRESFRVLQAVPDEDIQETMGVIKNLGGSIRVQLSAREVRVFGKVKALD